ncbi:cytochrome b5-like heme/steroid binding domain containing protein [Nitzschia inconspicua]|uniref:Cytochrome b5-like heme/steroid binding domain containing protein n=1 Tax=Nitzschia inconspicua TaxID=303405 RepID=A0A9K3L3M2_9STRA|nr:cytochrome b5-like heme/steroid binding domain containing protein [Nitzschia inconspicua]
MKMPRYITIVVAFLALFLDESTTVAFSCSSSTVRTTQIGQQPAALRSSPSLSRVGNSRRTKHRQSVFTVLFYESDGSSTIADMASSQSSSSPLDRFHRQASQVQQTDKPCILTIHGQRYNMTAWANSHPGGAKVLERFHDKDASKAFEAAHHSPEAYAMLKDFLVTENVEDKPQDDVLTSTASTIVTDTTTAIPWRRRFRKKLFTMEDPVGIHKYLGIFCLLNFLGRFAQMYFGDPAAGLGRRGHPWFSMACLLPHALLSVSSLIFHTVPKERVVGKPMIWQEFRVHNIVFGVRSVLTAFIASMSIKLGNTPTVRTLAILASGGCVLLANWGADKATEKFRFVEVESTTATMPYWEGCSMETQKKFKAFYAYCQFMATLACLACGNPAWPLSVLIAIQLASLLMTLVRKGLLSARGYHYGYTASLVMPYFVGLRSMLYTQSLEFPFMLVLGYTMFQLRRRGVSKYALWIPVILGRLLVGDTFISYASW